MLVGHAVGRRLGEIASASEEGAAAAAQADVYMAEQRIENPNRMTAMLVPGWPHPDS